MMKPRKKKRAAASSIVKETTREDEKILSDKLLTVGSITPHLPVDSGRGPDHHVAITK
jgi:hypothetical protein